MLEFSFSMPEFTFNEIIGYVSSILIVISITMKSFIRFRIINMIGAFLFVIYGLLIGSIPVALLNSFSVCINILYIYRYQHKKDSLKIIPYQYDSEFLDEFVTFYKNDILKFYPNFELNDKDDFMYFFIFRNIIPSGLFIIKKIQDHSAEVILDYVTHDYRDMMIGKFIYHENRQHFVDMGIMKMLIKSPDWKLRHYLELMGYKEIRHGEFEIKLIDNNV